MGLIDDMVLALSGGDAAGHAWLAQAMEGVVGTPDSPGPGLLALLHRLEQAGLGGAVQSWIGTGPNRPIAPEQLHAALGEAEVQRMAGRAGLTGDELVAKLSQHLPGIVNRMTPQGKFPPG